MNCSQLGEEIQKNPLAGWRCQAGDGFLRLESPFRYSDGGIVELFVESRGRVYAVTDFGEAFRFLQTHGIDPLRSSTRKFMIDLALRLGGATNDDGSIEITVENAGQVLPAAIRLGQIVTRVADLALSAKGVFGGTFSDILEEFVKTGVHGVEVQRSGTIKGRATSHQVDLVVRSHRGVSAIEGLSAATTTGANAQTAYTIQKFADIAAIGAGAPKRYAVLDDSSEVWSDSLRRQLENFAVVVDWERRDKLLEGL